MIQDNSEHPFDTGNRETDNQEIYRRLVDGLKRLDVNLLVPDSFTPEGSEITEIPTKSAVKVRIKSQGKLLLSFTLSVAGNVGQTLYVENYSSPIRGKGLGTAFYANLERFATSQGFSAIAGGNGEDNLAFFTDKLGRKRLSDLSPEERRILIGDEIDDGSMFTYKNLDIVPPTKRS